jgi:hypothetical protein
MRSSHWQLVAILSVFVLLALAYSLILPLGEAADEIPHFALIRFIAERGRPPLTMKERWALGSKGDASPIYHTMVVVLTQHVSVSALPTLPDIRQNSQRFIPMDKFPDMRMFHTEDETWPFHDIALAWHLARLPSILLGVATVIAVYATVLTIYPDRRTFAAAAAGFVAFLPRFVTSSAVITDDNLVVPLVAFSIYCLIRVAQDNQRRRIFVIMGALMGLAAAVKYHALVLLPEMTVVLAVLAWYKRWGWRGWLCRWGWTVLAFLLASGWWFAFLLVRFNQVAELGWVRGLAAPLGDPVLSAGLGRIVELQPGNATASQFTWANWAADTLRTFWIGFGLADSIPPAVYLVCSLFTLAAVMGLIRYAWVQVKRYAFLPREEKRTAWRFDIAVLAFHFTVYLGVVAMRYLLRHTPDTAQGRHLYPALAAIAFFFVLGLSTLLDWPRQAVPGKHRDKPLALSLGNAMLGFSILALPLFILPGYYPYLPIVTAEAKDVPISHRLDVGFAKGLNFAGYDLDASPAMAGEALPVTLYWQAKGTLDRDYLIELCLRDAAGRPVACHQGYPVDGRYPTRAWEAGYLIKDKVYLPTPACLLGGDYNLTLSASPLRRDTAATSVEKRSKLTVLGTVTLTASQRPPAGFEIWIEGERYSQGEIRLGQIRQVLTVITYGAAEAGAPRLLSADAVWPALAPDVAYQCPSGSAASVRSFAVDSAVKAGSYRLEVDGQIQYEPAVTVMTRFRDFSVPDGISTPLHALFGGEVDLLGYDVDLSPRQPSNTIYLTAYWRGRRTMSRDHVGVAYLLDHTATAWGQTEHTLGGPYPNILWAAGESVTEEYRLTINPQTPPGLYTIEFSVYDFEAGAIRYLSAAMPGESQPVDRLYLGRLRVTDPAEGQPPSHPFAARLGDAIQLLGYDLSAEQLAAGQPLRLALHWQASHQPAADYTVFTQLLGPDGQVWAQFDNQPQAGRYPTSAWAVQTKIVDRYELKLKEGAPSGDYRLLVGMYDLASGQRLPAVAADGSPFPDNAIPLITLARK